MVLDLDSPTPRSWVAAVLDLCLLAILDRGGSHGYGIARALEDAGVATVKGGTLYPALARLEAAGLVAHHWEPGQSGPPRKCYALTDSGRNHLRVTGAQWIAFTERTSALLVVGDPSAYEDASDTQTEVERQ